MRRGLLRWFGCRRHRRIDRGEPGLARHEAPQVHQEVDPETRRRFNQAIFKKLLVSPEGVEGSELTSEFQGLLNEQLPGQVEKIAATPKPSHFEDGSNLEALVPPAGLEPAPRGLKGRRSNQLSYRGEVPMVEAG